MKKILMSLVFLGFGVLFFGSCESNKDEAPQLPPYESMAIDFSKISIEDKSATEMVVDTTMWNYASAGITVFVWNTALTITLAVPVASFYQAINQTPVSIGDKTWQWEYSVNGFGNTYKARLTGTIRSEDVKWEMYITKDGILAHPEFLWFEGTSNLDGKSGQWTLFESYLVQEEVLQIDWSKTGDEVGSVIYTYVRESNNGDPAQLTIGSNLAYGLVEGDLDAFYNIDYNNRNRADSADLAVNIEWSTTTYNGRIKAEHYFQDANWHCWDSDGYDTNCD